MAGKAASAQQAFFILIWFIGGYTSDMVLAKFYFASTMKKPLLKRGLFQILAVGLFFLVKVVIHYLIGTLLNVNTFVKLVKNSSMSVW